MLPVVVVGSGLAGLTASLSLAEMNYRVIIIEKNSQIGGNSIKASSGINSCETQLQAKLGINDTCSSFLNDTMKSGGNLSVYDLVQLLRRNYELEWLQEQSQVEFNQVLKCGGHQNARTHGKRNAPIGYSLIQGLKNMLSKHQNVKIMLNTKCTDIIEFKGEIVGVELEQYCLQSRHVVLATGGYAAASFLPHIKHKQVKRLAEFYATVKADKGYTHQEQILPTTNGNWATGDALHWIEKLNGSIIQMEQIQIHPTAFLGPSNPMFLAPESLRAVGGLLLNQQGKRFVDELEKRNIVTEAILKEQKCCFLILDSRMANLVSMDFYLAKGFFAKASLSDGAEMVNSTAEYLESQGLSSTIYIAKVIPAIHYTMGGIEIDSLARVKRKNGSVITGLYAAGEATGGLHGANRLAGNSLLECLVFGRQVAYTIHSSEEVL